MAKSKSFFGLRRGSTKSHTYSVFNGQQVTKDRVDTVKNPRSEAQMYQRMVMKTAGLAYSNMKQIVDHSFEGKTYGLQSMMAFLGKNGSAISKLVKKWQDDPQNTSIPYQFAEYQSTTLQPGSYVIAQGSASKILVVPVFDNSVLNKTTIKLLGASNKATTAADLFELLGVAIGELCTVCFLWFDGDSVEWHFDFVRITALATGDVALTAANYGDYIKVESTLPIDAITFGTADSPNGISVQVSTQNSEENSKHAIVAIHSVQADGKWLRSNAQFDCSGFIEGSGDIEEIFATYPVGQNYVLNGANF